MFKLILLILVINQIVAYIGVTVFIWFQFWKKVPEYSLYDVLFKNPDLLEFPLLSVEEEELITWKALSRFRHIPAMNTLSFVIIVISIIYNILYSLTIEPLKKIKFHSKPKPETSGDAKKEDGDGIIDGADKPTII